MDATGIAMQILSLSCPGVQIFAADEGCAMARASNDELADGHSQVSQLDSQASQRLPRRTPPKPRVSWPAA